MNIKHLMGLVAATLFSGVVFSTPVLAQINLAAPTATAISSSYACYSATNCDPPVTDAKTSGTSVFTSVSAINGADINASATVSGGPVFLSASATGPVVNGQPNVFVAYSYITYQFEITGGTDPVLLDATANLYASANSDWPPLIGITASAAVGLFAGGNNIGSTGVCVQTFGSPMFHNGNGNAGAGAGCTKQTGGLYQTSSPDNDSPFGGTSSQNINAAIYVPENIPITVLENVWVSFSGGGTVISANAKADPYFHIDPKSLGDNPGLQLTFSDGVNNAPLGPVPEPGVWALMIGGFGLTGVALRRRRAIVTA